MNKAVYIATYYDKKAERVEQEYEYRGQKYIVYRNLKGHEHMTLRGQHQEEQRKIDEALDNPQQIRLHEKTFDEEINDIWRANGWA